MHYTGIIIITGALVIWRENKMATPMNSFTDTIASDWVLNSVSTLHLYKYFKNA